MKEVPDSVTVVGRSGRQRFAHRHQVRCPGGPVDLPGCFELAAVLEAAGGQRQLPYQVSARLRAGGAGRAHPVQPVRRLPRPGR